MYPHRHGPNCAQFMTLKGTVKNKIMLLILKLKLAGKCLFLPQKLIGKRLLSH
jgi:hypothetical protein